MTFVYNRWVDRIAVNKTAFSFCIHNLFPAMNYSVLTETDVRDIDLKEWLTKLPTMIPEQVKEKYPGTVDFYLFMLKLYLDEKLICKEGSRAERYKNRAYELIEEAKTNTSLNCESDALIIFLSLFRTLKDYLDETKKPPVDNPTINVELEDADLLYAIYKNNSLVPGRVIEKKGFIDILFGTEVETRKAIKFFYINSILLLTEMLLDRGLFDEEGDNE